MNWAVWVVSRGELNGGQSPKAVFYTKERAVEFAMKEKTHFEGGWNEAGVLVWTNGCDAVIVEKFRVRK